MLNGKVAQQKMGTSPASISSRLFMVEFARANTWGLTATQKQQMGFVQDALSGLLPQLNKLMQTDFPAFRKSLVSAGAPWVPEGLMKEIPDEPVEID